MKPYGLTRKDNLTCHLGCCKMKRSKKHPALRRRAKKAARRLKFVFIYTHRMPSN